MYFSRSGCVVFQNQHWGGRGGGEGGFGGGEVECLEYSSEPQADKHILIYHRLTVLLLWGRKKRRKKKKKKEEEKVGLPPKFVILN